jgi:hypothetical protein
MALRSRRGLDQIPVVLLLKPCLFLLSGWVFE